LRLLGGTTAGSHRQDAAVGTRRRGPRAPWIHRRERVPPAGIRRTREPCQGAVVARPCQNPPLREIRRRALPAEIRHDAGVRGTCRRRSLSPGIHCADRLEGRCRHRLHTPSSGGGAPSLILEKKREGKRDAGSWKREMRVLHLRCARLHKRAAVAALAGGRRRRAPSAAPPRRSARGHRCQGNLEELRGGNGDVGPID
jgi:hypothetical protein